MNFKTAIIWLGRFYRLLEKIKLENKFQLDSFIDNNYPWVISKIQTYANNGKIAVCGTNGKKTTLDLINQILEKDNKTFITNVTKDSVIYPVLTSIILDLSKTFSVFNDDIKKDYYLMAMDCFEMPLYFNTMKFDYLLLHNAFTDQKNYYSLEEKRKKIQESIVLNSKLNLIINADDPVFYEIDEIKNDTTFNKKRNKIYYGFENIEYAIDDDELIQNNDLIRCPKCSCVLDYKKRFYSHLGQYDCECGFKRPKLDISADVKIFSDYSFLNVYYDDNKFVFKVPLGGLYNAYNALGAISLALVLGINRKTITEAFENYRPIRARDEILKYENKKIKIKTIVNPTSLSESIRELYGAKNKKVVFCLNDEIEDGVDTSWIWDSNFNSLKGFENKIYITSNRFDDMALRLKYANINPCLLVMDGSIKSAVKTCLYELEEKEEMIIFATPSCINEIYNIFNHYQSKILH